MPDSSSLLKIIEFWRAMPLGNPPFVHPEDLPAMQLHAAELLALPTANFQQFLTSQRFGGGVRLRQCDGMFLLHQRA